MVQNMSNQNRLNRLSAAQVARMIGLSRAAVCAMYHAGKLAGANQPSGPRGKILIPRETVDAMMSSRPDAPTQAEIEI